MTTENIQNSPDMLGDHPKIREILRIVAKISATNSAVLIVGESGTGKELVARAIHKNSIRSDKPFLIISCAGIPETQIENELFGYEKGSLSGANSSEAGIIEMATGGTVFFEDVSELNKVVQSKLFRVIQDKQVCRIGGKANIPVDVRIISASNKELGPEIKQGNFREDLFYRLNVININLPPLRERGSDIASLATHFVNKYSESSDMAVNGISQAALQMLLCHSWPGNVRQLESVIERAVLMASSSCIAPDDLPIDITSAHACGLGEEPKFVLPAKGINFEQLEKDIIEQAMERADWVIGRAAPLLGMTYKTLQYRLDKFGLKRRAV